MTALAWVAGISAALFLLFRFPRQVGILVAVLLLVALGIGGYFYAQNERTKHELASVETKASGANPFCTDPSYPVWVYFKNTSANTLDYVSFSLQARRVGYSGTAYSNYQSSDRIVAPGDAYGSCWSLASYSKPTEPPSALEWSVELYTATFR